MKTRNTPDLPYESALDALAAESCQLRVVEHTPERYDHRLAMLGLLQELRSLVERRNVKPH